MNNGIGHAFLTIIEALRFGPEFKIHLLDAPLAVSRNDSSASSARSSRVVNEDQDGNRGQSAAWNGGVLSTQGGNKVDAGDVKEEFVVRSSLVRSFVARSPVVRSSVVPSPVSHYTLVVNGVFGTPIDFSMLGRQWISVEPNSNELSAWCRPNIRRPVVLSRSHH